MMVMGWAAAVATAMGHGAVSVVVKMKQLEMEIVRIWNNWIINI